MILVTVFRFLFIDGLFKRMRGSKLLLTISILFLSPTCTHLITVSWIRDDPNIANSPQSRKSRIERFFRISFIMSGLDIGELFCTYLHIVLGGFRQGVALGLGDRGELCYGLLGDYWVSVIWCFAGFNVCILFCWLVCDDETVFAVEC